MVWEIKYGHNRNISKLMTSNFRNKIIFWDISKWNRGQTNYDEWIIIYFFFWDILCALGIHSDKTTLRTGSYGFCLDMIVLLHNFVCTNKKLFQLHLIRKLISFFFL